MMGFIYGFPVVQYTLEAEWVKAGRGSARQGKAWLGAARQGIIRNKKRSVAIWKRKIIKQKKRLR